MITNFLGHRLLRAVAGLAIVLACLLPTAVSATAAGGTIQLSRATAAPNDAVNVQGTGFFPGDRVIVTTSFLVNGTYHSMQADAVVQANGAFIAGIRVPIGTAPGVYQVTARDPHGDIAVRNLTVLALVHLPAGGSSTTTIRAGHYFYVTGGGYTPHEMVTIRVIFPLYSGSSIPVVRAVQAGADGRLPETMLQVPNDTKAGQVTMTATGATSGKKGTAAIKVMYRPVIRVNPTTSRPGGTVAVTGQGFAPGGIVHVSLSAQTTAGSYTISKNVQANAAGDITTAFALPAATRAGTYTMTATGTTTGASATRTFAVSLEPILVVTPNPAVPGQTVTVSGRGYSANVSITITATVPLYGGGTHTLYGVTRTGPKGAFSTHLTIPGKAAAGTIQMLAKGPAVQAAAAVTIGHIAATIAVSPAQAAPGAPVTVTGSHYPAGDRVTVSMTVRMTDGSTRKVVVTATADANGSFSTTLSVPGAAALGSYTIVATSAASGRAPTATVHVALSGVASVVVQPNPAVPGHTVVVSGGGYGGNAPITITLTVPLYGGGTKTVTASTQTGPKGHFATQVQIPGHAAAGTIQVRAQGPNRSAASTLAIGHIVATIALSQTETRPGSSIIVNGSGYPSGDTVTVTMNVHLTNGTTQVLTAIGTANSNGQFRVVLQIPSSAAVGTYTVTAHSAATGRAPTASLHLGVNAGIALNPNAARPGRTITVTGAGFSANAGIRLTATFPLFGSGSKTVAATVQSDASGNFTTRIAVPMRAIATAVTVVAQGPNARAVGMIYVRKLGATLVASPPSAVPGSTVAIAGSSYLPNDRVDISVTVKTTSGASQTLTAVATTGANGNFTASIHLPGGVTAGVYTVTAKSESTGRAPTAHFTVAALAPSIVPSSPTAAPGAQVSVTGFGWAPGATVRIAFQGQTITTATADATGKFITQLTVPAHTATGAYSLTASSSFSRTATSKLSVQRQVSTHFYFASLYTGTGYEENIAILNPSQVQGQVTITYELTNGATRQKSITVAPHTRVTESVNADLGARVSAAVAIAADVPIVAERLVYHQTDGSIVPGTRAPSSVWYFADGNTSHGYREFVAVQNPSSSTIQVAVRLLPTHSRAFTIYRSMPAHSRTTFKINSFVHDAVGVVVRSATPVVANRTIFIRQGMASKIGASAPHRTWYFAGGAQNPSARYWIAAINPMPQWARVTLHAYAPSGEEIGTTTGWIKPYGRQGYLINKIAHTPNVSVAITAGHGIVAEQMTYAGRGHLASTGSFGVNTPNTSWGFAAVDTWSGRNESDRLDLFNPNLTPAAVVVQFMAASGQVVQRTYIVGPLGQVSIDVGSVMPNARLGVVASSSVPFVALNRLFFNGRTGSDTSHGIAIGS